MRLLILTQYYPPEIGAPQNRLHELAVRLQAKGVHVEVLTAMPNYPKMEIQQGYENGKIREEQIDGIAVHRAKIYVSTSKSIVKRLLNYFSFVWTSYWRGRKLEAFDYLMVESPPLFLGYSAMRLAKKLKAKLIFNVSDLWPESAEKLGLVTNKKLLGLAYNLEEKCYRSAHIVTGQTAGIVQDISKRFSDVTPYWLPNGVDLTYYDRSKYQQGNYRSKHGFTADQKLFFYGGVIGYAQGLDVILQAAVAFTDRPEVQFILQGAGPEKDRLIELKGQLNLKNVHFIAPVTKQEMPEVLMDVDAAIIPLKKLELFEGAIPSKIFETLAMEIPILLAVKGEARDHFVHKANAALPIEPEDTEDLKMKIQYFLDHPVEMAQMGKKGRDYALTHFDRNLIASKFLEQLQA